MLGKTRRAQTQSTGKKLNTAIFRGFSTHRWAKTEVFETKRRPRGSQFVLLGAHHGQLWRVREPGFLLKHVGSWAIAHVLYELPPGSYNSD